MVGISNRSQRFVNILILAVLIVGAALAIGPMLYMVSTAFKGQIYVLETPPQLIPQQPTLQNFDVAINARNFFQAFLNSLSVAIGTMILDVTVTSMMAYAFARFDFRGKNLIFYSMLAMMTVPTMMLIIPQFLLGKSLGFINSLPGLAIAYTAGGVAFHTFLLRGFFESLPHELEESAVIDGASAFTIYLRVILPLSTPALSTVAVFSFLGAWDEFIWALTVLTDESKRTLPIVLANFRGAHASNWGLVFAGSTLTVLPALLIFLFFQRYFVQGLTAGAVRG